MGNVIIQQWENWMQLCGEKQAKYYKEKIRNARECSCVSFRDVFTEEEIKKIIAYCRFEQRQCYMNAYRLAMLFPDRVKYVEGEVAILNGVLPIAHAWNLVDDTFYVDFTFEYVLGEDVTKLNYVVLGNFNTDVIRDVAVVTGVYGGVFDYLFINSI